MTMADPVLTAERDQLRRSREYLRLMREDVLSITPMAGDRVSLEFLKADLYRRAEALKDLPDAPLFFGRLDYREELWDGSASSEPEEDGRHPPALGRRRQSGGPGPGGDRGAGSPPMLGDCPPG